MFENVKENLFYSNCTQANLCVTNSWKPEAALILSLNPGTDNELFSRRLAKTAATSLVAESISSSNNHCPSKTAFKKIKFN